MPLEANETGLPPDNEDLEYPDDELLALKDQVVAAMTGEVNRKEFNAQDREAMSVALKVVIDDVLQGQEASDHRRVILFDEAWDELTGLGPLQYFLDDPSVAKVVVNGPTDIVVERNGRFFQSRRRFRHNAHIMEIAGRILKSFKKELSENEPAAEGDLPDGSHFKIESPPVSVGHCLTISKPGSGLGALQEAELQDDVVTT